MENLSFLCVTVTIVTVNVPKRLMIFIQLDTIRKARREYWSTTECLVVWFNNKKGFRLKLYISDIEIKTKFEKGRDRNP